MTIECGLEVLKEGPENAIMKRAGFGRMVQPETTVNVQDKGAQFRDN